jgi:hypothetical protein
MNDAQKRSLFVKGATLTTFVVLMGAFIAFKAGAFDSKAKEPLISVAPETTHHRNATMNSVANTTAAPSIPEENRVQQRVADEYRQQQMMFSSKTAIAAEPIEWFPIHGKPNLLHSMASSSKSTVLVESVPWWQWIDLYEPHKPGEKQGASFSQGRK